MTWIGKILSVFVLILGVAAMWFMATVYVARTNWKNDRDQWAAAYAEAEKARKKEETAYRTELDSVQQQLAAERTRIKGLDEQVAKLKTANDTVVAANKLLTDTISKNDVNAVDLAANLQALTDEANKLRARSNELEKERQGLVIARENALKDRQTFENLAKQANAEKAVVDGKLESLQAQIAELKSTGGRADAVVLNSFGKPAAPLPDGIRGTVTNYKDGYVQLSIGIDAGLTPGAVLDIFRSEGGGQYLGTIMIERAYPKEAVAIFKPADVRRSIAKLRPEELPKVGDTVGKIGISGPISLKK